MRRAATAPGAMLLAMALACGPGEGGPAGPEAPSGPVPIQGRIGDVQFHAVLLQPSWDRLVGRITLLNATPDVVVLRFPDSCIVLMRLYGLFDNRLVADAHSKRCLPVPVEVVLEPGASRTFETNVTFFFVLGNEVPEGRYHATLYLRPEGSQLVEIAVGRPRLVRPDEPAL